MESSKSSSKPSRNRIQKRRRIAISCTECHRRKQKCDRQNPCRNCIKRQKENLCHYESRLDDFEPPTCAPSGYELDHPVETNREPISRSSENEDSPYNLGYSSHNSLDALDVPFTCAPSGFDPDHVVEMDREPTSCSSENEDAISNFGYSGHSSLNTLGLLRATNRSLTSSCSVSGLSTSSTNIADDDTSLKYKDLVRRIPSPACVDILTHTFFSSVNWQYGILDEQNFRNCLKIWRQLNYHELCSGPWTLAPETRVFPALLLQVLAHALLFHDPLDSRLTSMVNLQGMALHELGGEYSEISADILTLLGKRAIAVATVQAGLMRAAFLKSSGKVVEAWHLLGATIRDAQELGLHTSPTVSSRNGSDGIRIWICLHIWDIHMAVVLGRPMTTDLDLDTFTGKIEDFDQREALFSRWKSENDSPRPFDIILAGYNVAYKHFPEIHRLGTRKVLPQDRKIVDAIHASVEREIRSLPSWCQLEDVNTMFDELPECQWLPIARDGMWSLIHLVILTLHRPYIFSVPDSCRKAVRAGLAILRAQERIFQRVDPQQCRVFNPVYAAFDAIVLVAAAHLAASDCIVDLQVESLQAIETGIERLDAIGRHNPMARSAHSVVLRLYHRLKRGRSNSGSTDMTSAQSDNSLGGTTPASFGGPFHDIPPPQPIHDLFYNHISGPQFIPAADGLTSNQVYTDPSSAWGIDQTFSDTNFWEMINSEFLINT